MREPQPHVRIQHNLSAQVERRLLNWLCARLPAWVTPDMLTATGVFGAAVIGAGYVLSSWGRDWLFLSIAGYVINWFGDSLDGSVARFRKIERPRYGYFLDHSVDGIAVMMMTVGMGLSPYLRVDIMLLALSGYLLLAIHAFLSAKVVGELTLSHVGAGPTELRFLLITLTLAMWALGPRFETRWTMSGFDQFVGVIGLALVALYVVQTFNVARRLSREDPPTRA